MRICVLNPSYEQSASPFAEWDPDCDPTPYVPDRRDWRFESVNIHQRSVNRQMRELILGGGYDLFFNLCDGAWDEDRPGIDVVRMLEVYGVPFTGADSAFYEPSKETMKMVATYEGIPTPAYVFAFSPEDVEGALRSVPLPVVVKHFNGYSSIGMTRECLCRDPDSVRREAGRIIREYGGALIEVFVSGPEYNVLLAENPDDPGSPIALAPVECRLPEGEEFKHFELKWVNWEGMEWAPVQDEAVASVLRDRSIRIFKALGGVSYARCDFRLDPVSGDPQFLEINPNCAIFYPPDVPGSADFTLMIDPMGAEGFLDLVIRSAFARADRRASGRGRKWRVHHDGNGHHGLVAATPIAGGELVMKGEETPYYLTSRFHVENGWDAEKKDAFARYAWPVAEDLFAVWSPEPSDWRPLNHSCDPNTWFGEECSLDVYARRPIAAGEEITMDYATFCGPGMQAFDCGCGAAVCRGTVSGSDCRQPWVVERFGTRVTAYIKSLHDGPGRRSVQDGSEDHV